MEYLRVRNWTKYQHYRDRNPPWIKLHVEILASADWVTLPDASKLLAVVCMIVAAKHDGMVPDSPDYLQRVAYLSKRPNLTPLIECGFLEKAQATASTLQADASGCKQSQATARPEKEAEAEKEKIYNGHSPEFEAFWQTYPRKVGKGSARKAFASAAKKAPVDTIMVGLKRYAVERAREDPKYTAHPATWLNQERWMDEPSKPQGRPMQKGCPL